MQKIEQYYGFNLGLADKISHREFDSIKERLREAAKALQSKSEHKVNPYISMCLFSLKRPRMFGHDTLAGRLAKLSLSWTVNPEEQRKKTICFLNEELGEKVVLIDNPVAHSFKKFSINCELDGKYVEEHDTFKILIAADVGKRVVPRRRKVTLTATAHPTPEFSSRIYNGSGQKITKINYHLSVSVQLLLDLS